MQDATGSVHKELRTVNHRSNKESFLDLCPIALTHYVRKQSELFQAFACLNTPFFGSI